MTNRTKVKQIDLTRKQIIKELLARGYHNIDKKDSTIHLRCLLGIYESKEKQSMLINSQKGLVKFAHEVLPQAGKLCFDIGNLNDSLLLSRKAFEGTTNL